MKNFIIKYKKQIELIISMIGIVLTFITLTHNIRLVDVILSFDSFQINYDNNKIHSVELLSFFIPIKYRKSVVPFYHKHFCKLAWCNFFFFLSGTIYTNLLLGYVPLHHIGIVTILEGIVLVFEKKPVEKLNRFIDFIIPVFK